MFQIAQIVQAAQGTGQDRLAILRDGEKVIVLIADGAGGRSGGSEAAELAIRLMSGRAMSLTSAADCERLLRDVDRAVAIDTAAGETTATLVVVNPTNLFGASVGDSGAWIVGSATIDELTGNQVPKPFLGTGASMPVSFARSACSGTLLVATDGLLKYSSREMIANAVGKESLDEALVLLVGLVRYPSGALPDDLAIVLCRRVP